MRTAHITLSPRMAGEVRRYSGWPTLRQQTNAHHTWNVMRIYCEVFGAPRSEVFYHMLHHDSGELRAGDVAHHVKANNVQLKAFMDAAEEQGREQLGISLPPLEAYERWAVKVADLLEMAEFSAEEQEMGNARMGPVTSNIEWALYGQTVKLETEYIPGRVELYDRLMSWVHTFNNRCVEGGRARQLILDGTDRR